MMNPDSFPPVDARGERVIARRLTRRRFSQATAAAVTAPLLPGAVRAAQIGTPAASPAASPVPPGATPAASGPQLIVQPTTVRIDEPFDVWVTGLKSGQKVSIDSSFGVLGARGWTAGGTWIAEGDYLDLAAQAPSEGDFTVPDPMGLIWAAYGGPNYSWPFQGTETVALNATVDGRAIGRAEVQRGLSLGPNQPTHINSDQMVGDFFAPAPGSPTPAPAVIVLHGSEGWPSTGVDMTAAALAAHGYAALALGYFGAIGNLPRTLQAIPLEYFGTAITWLRQQPAVRKDRIGVIGYSRGAELALLLGAYYPELKAVVSISGSGYAGPAVSGWGQPAWTWQGKPVPFWSSPTASPQQLASVEIPVERIHGPILLVSGDGDREWSSSGLSGVAWQRLQRFSHDWPDQFLHYPGAGHGIFVPYMPALITVPPNLGGDPLSNEIASVNSWQAVLHLFEARLRF